jgi:subtilisin family serine protease
MQRQVESDGYIVRFKKDQVDDVDSHVRNMVARHSITPGKTFKHSIKGFSVKGNIPEQVLDRLRGEDTVEAVEPDVKAKAFLQYVPWAISRIGCKNIGTGTTLSNVHIFMLDTGVSKHPDLNVVESLSFCQSETSTDDLNGHGTMTAGCAAAKDDGNYVVGVAPGAKLHSYKVLGQDGSGYFSDIISAVDAVIQYRQAHTTDLMIMNLSLGGYTGDSTYNSLDLAIVSAIKDNNITTVVAAGNDGADASLYTPAHVTEAITAGAYDVNNKFADFSNYGTPVDILAPGVDILTTAVGSAMAIVSGTSFSSPYVAGAAALYLSKNPSATPGLIQDQLKKMAAQTYNGANPQISTMPVNTTPYSLYVSSV